MLFCFVVFVLGVFFSSFISCHGNTSFSEKICSLNECKSIAVLVVKASNDDNNTVNINDESLSVDSNAAVDPCSTYYRCSTCTARFGCGWCYSGNSTILGSCSSGSSSGPTYPVTCPAQNWYYYKCPCFEGRSCSACLGSTGCGWCLNSCISGDVYGPSTGNCSYWQYSSCSFLPCSSRLSCASCTSGTGCGMCDGVCVVGYSYGARQKCNSWIYYNFDCGDSKPLSSTAVFLIIFGCCCVVALIITFGTLIYLRRRHHSTASLNENILLLPTDPPPEAADAPDVETCLICQDSKVNVVLPCGHPYCHSCLSEWRKAKSGRGYTCPQCRATIADPESYFLI